MDFSIEQIEQIEQIEPKSVFTIFKQIAAIPHGSHNTAALSAYCANFAREHGLRYSRDESGNVIIYSEGNGEPLILQGHLDMVCEKQADCPIDMEKQGLELEIEGDYISAKGTTLGGDDGIAVAMILALLADSSLKKPPIEAVFTVDEEVGMLGAARLDFSLLTARRMINLDSEDEGVFTVSCAGGNRTLLTLPVTREEFGGAAITLRLHGLRGGHSGTEIDKGRANASLLMGRMLDAVSARTEVRISDLRGGQKDNAIPTECTSVVTVADKDKAIEAAVMFAECLRAEYSLTDGGIALTVEETNGALPLDKGSTERVIRLLNCTPNGVIEMSAAIKGLTQTSLNLGILTLDTDRLCAEYCVRSSVSSQKAMLGRRLLLLAQALGGSAECFGDYPAWEYRESSPLRDVMSEQFLRLYGKKPVVSAIHAGVECGLFAGAISGLDCVSMGPDMKDIHTTGEKLSVSSTKRTWELLCAVLEALATD